MPMLVPCSGTVVLFASSACSISRHVLGSGTVSAIGTFNSRITAAGLGPRTINRVLPRAARNSAREDTVSAARSEEHTSELQSHSDLVCRLLLEKKKKQKKKNQ